MYLSQLVLNIHDRQARQDLADCHCLHRTLLRAYPDGVASDGAGARARSRLLFRVDEDARTGAVSVLAQSQLAPSWERLPAGYVRSSACKEIGGILAGITAHTRLRFRLRANVTKKIETKTSADGTRRNGRRVELHGEAARIQWLERKATQHGFAVLRAREAPEVVNLQQIEEGKRRGFRQTADGPRRIIFGSVLFEGELEVMDEGRFREALATGVGPGKAYGFGLLSVAATGR